MMKARIKADDNKQQKEEFQATSKKQIETKNGKQEPLLTLSSRERKREQSNKKEDIRFSRITSRGYKDTPELRLDYNFRWLRGSWGIVKVLETKGRKRRGLARTTWKERKTKFRRHFARGKMMRKKDRFLSLSLFLLGGFKGTRKALKRDERCLCAWRRWQWRKGGISERLRDSWPRENRINEKLINLSQGRSV